MVFPALLDYFHVHKQSKPLDLILALLIGNKKVTVSRSDGLDCLLKTLPMCSFHVPIATHHSTLSSLNIKHFQMPPETNFSFKCQSHVVAVTVFLLFLHFSYIWKFDSLIFVLFSVHCFTDHMLCIYLLHSISFLFRKEVTNNFASCLVLLSEKPHLCLHLPWLVGKVPKTCTFLKSQSLSLEVCC